LVAFILLYFHTSAVLTFATLLTRMPLVTAFTSVVAGVNTLGPTLGPTGPAGTFQVLTDAHTWVCAIDMILGRLEIFSVLFMFTAAFRRK